MTTIITRLYADGAKAHSVIDELLTQEFEKRDIDVFAIKAAPEPVEDALDEGEEDAPAKSRKKSKAPSKAAQLEDLVSQLKEAGVYPNAAAVYGKHVLSGEALLVVRAPFGTALRATEIVDSFQPKRADVKYSDVYVPASEKIKPYERRYQPSLLTDTEIMSGSAWRATTTSGPIFSSTIGIPLLTQSRGKAKLITNRPTWFSSLLGLTLLLKDRPSKPRKKRHPTPFSAMFSLPLLIKSRR